MFELFSGLFFFLSTIIEYDLTIWKLNTRIYRIELFNNFQIKSSKENYHLSSLR